MDSKFENHVSTALNSKGEVYWDSELRILTYFSEDFVLIDDLYCNTPLSHIYRLHAIRDRDSDAYELIGISIFYIEYLLNDWTFTNNLFKRDSVPLKEVVTKIWGYLDNKQRLKIVDAYEQLIQYIVKNNPVIPRSMMSVMYLDHVDKNKWTIMH